MFLQYLQFTRREQHCSSKWQVSKNNLCFLHWSISTKNTAQFDAIFFLWCYSATWCCSVWSGLLPEEMTLTESLSSFKFLNITFIVCFRCDIWLLLFFWMIYTLLWINSSRISFLFFILMNGHSLFQYLHESFIIACHCICLKIPYCISYVVLRHINMDVYA